MRLNREELLHKLEAVQGGLAKREVLEQSSCFVFKNGVVLTYNEEVACRYKVPLEIEGAVHAPQLLAVLQKMVETDIEVNVADGHLVIKGQGRRSGVRMEAEVLLRLEDIEAPARDSWVAIPDDLAEAVQTVQQCAGTDENAFALTCIHLHPNHVEACDNYQMARYPIQTGCKVPTLVKRDALRHLLGLDMTHLAETKTWLHFRNPAGLIMSTRRYAEPFPDLQPFLQVEGMLATLPGGLVDAVDKAEIFSAENADANQVVIDLATDKLRLIARSANGWHEERQNISYQGPPMKFCIAPKVMKEIAKRHNQCIMAPGRLKVDTGRFVYVTCLGAVAE